MTVVPALHGWQWLVRGFILFRVNPAMWILLVFTWWVLVGLISHIPIAGPLAAGLLTPAFSVSFMELCREIEERGRVRPPLLLAGFRNRLATLIVLGGLYLVSIMLALGISAFADGGALATWAVYGNAPDVAVIRDGSLSRALIVASLAGTPVIMAFWFAPVLIAWQGMGAAKALFFSFFGCWRNWRAFLVYGGLLTALVLALSATVLTAAIVLRGPPEALRFGMVMLVLTAMPTLFGSFYAAYRDVFPPGSSIDEGKP